MEKALVQTVSGEGKLSPPKRQKRTNFSSLQREELEMAFNQSQYVTPHSRHKLQELGIPKDKIKVWFKNRRAKWRKETLHGCSSKKRRMKDSPDLQNSASHRVILPKCWNHLQTAADLLSEDKSTQGQAVMLDSYSLPFNSDFHEIWSHTGEISLGATSSSCNENILSPAGKNATFSQNWFHFPSPVNTAEAMNNGIIMLGNGSATRDVGVIRVPRVMCDGGVIWDAGETIDASVIRDGVVLRDAAVNCGSGMLHDISAWWDTTEMHQTQPSSRSIVPWMENSSGLGGSLNLIYEGDHLVPKHCGEEAYDRLQQADLSQSMAQWESMSASLASHQSDEISKVTFTQPEMDLQNLEDSLLLDDLMEIIAKA